MENTKIILLSNVNLEVLNEALSKDNDIYHIEGYNQWVQYAIDQEKMNNIKPRLIFLLLDGYPLFKDISDISQELNNNMAYIEKLASNNPSVPIYVSNIDIQPLKIIQGDDIRPEHKIMEQWEEALKDCIQRNINLHLFDLRTIIENLGRENFYSNQMWYLGSIPCSIKGINLLSERINKIIKSQSQARKKVLILDLDNTLWGGVLGEDGLEGIQLSNSYIGAAYKDAQMRIKELQGLGVLLAIVSKNNEEDVMKVLKDHPHMVLKEDDFVAIYANWNPKSSNILDMANRLNLGLDSFVFLDDNPVEREAVRLAIPEVVVAEFPKDVANLPNVIVEISRDYFFSTRLTKEDFEKTGQYQQESKRQKVLENSASIEDYLRSLEIIVNLHEMTEAQIERVAQLTQKTNQFNLMTGRYSAEQLVEYKSNNNNHIYVANVSDKFGDSGLVFVMMVSTDGNVATIDNLLMSCRVMGRFIEDTAINSIEQKLMAQGITEIKAKFIPTAKNKPVVNLMDRLGYAMVNSEDDIKNYARILGEECEDRRILFEPIWT
ncbi:HAD-IIIC family phosphatase [Tissierella creatinini]|nr:HAD-IIIC family phosphatase [Tissierella creatinini]TJX62226.1 HAD-IIIC family phosphatase [Soehngenia saccharolytica]